MNNVSSLQNRLRGEWSAHNAHQLISQSGQIIQIGQVFHELEKPTKIRLLVSFLLLDDAKRLQYKEDIHRVCVKACTDPDMWVKVTSEIVMRRLGLETLTSMIDKITASCVESFEVTKQSAALVSAPYFLPLEYKYLNSAPVELVDGQNPHFHATFAMPLLIPLEDFRQEDIPQPMSSVSEPDAEQNKRARTESERVRIDLNELFTEFPDVSATDRAKIEAFESDECECFSSTMLLLYLTLW